MQKLSFAVICVLIFRVLCSDAPLRAQSTQRADQQWHFRYDLFQMLLEQRGMSTMQPLASALDTPASTTVVLVGELGRVRKEDWSRLSVFVRLGGNALIASDRSIKMPGIGEILEGPVTATREEDRYLEFRDCIRIRNMADDHVVTRGLKEIISNRTGWFSPLDGRTSPTLFQWRAIASLPDRCSPSASNSRPLIIVNEPQTDREGFIVVMSDPSILSNGMMWHAENSTIAIRLSVQLSRGKKTKLSFLFGGQLQAPNPSNQGEKTNGMQKNPPMQNPPMEMPPLPLPQELPETDLSTKLKVANLVLKRVEDSNIFNEALKNQPRNLNLRRYQQILLVSVASAAALVSLFFLFRRVSTGRIPIDSLPHATAFELDASAIADGNRYRPAAFILAREFLTEWTGVYDEETWQRRVKESETDSKHPFKPADLKKLRYVLSIAMPNHVSTLTEREFLSLGKAVQELRKKTS